jgi:hypothetical protein
MRSCAGLCLWHKRERKNGDSRRTKPAPAGAGMSEQRTRSVACVGCACGTTCESKIREAAQPPNTNYQVKDLVAQSVLPRSSLLAQAAETHKTKKNYSTSR